jgi:hypothetical protein
MNMVSMWCEKKNPMVELAKDPVNFNTPLVPCKGAACLRWVDSRHIHTCNKAHARVGISPGDCIEEEKQGRIGTFREMVTTRINT